MSKRLKISLMILIVVLIALTVGLGVGSTAAIWTTAGAGAGENTVAPASDSVNWNAWAKYFEYADFDDDALTVAVTKFHRPVGEEGTDEIGLNLETLIIPNSITHNAKTYNVVEVKSQIFADSTLRDLPTKIMISPNIKRIAPSAFANLPNLKQVEFGTNLNGQRFDCEVSPYTFMMCKKLEIVITNGHATFGGAALSKNTSAFFGCNTSALTVV